MAQLVISPTLLRLARSLWRTAVPRSFRRYGQRYASALALHQTRSIAQAAKTAPERGPVIVSGLLSDVKGISTGARLTLKGLRAAGLQPIAHDLQPIYSGRSTQAQFLPTCEKGGVLLLHVNAPEAVTALARIEPQAWVGRYRIGYWAYELPRVPKYWVDAANLFHEIWVPSDFVRAAMVQSGVLVPVRVMPHPVALGQTQLAERNRARLGWSENDFVVLAMGELESSATRKNLLGAIAAFKSAFPVEGVARLVVKTHSARNQDAFLRRASQLRGGRSDVMFIGERLTAADIEMMIASSDLVFSPHRSEGFGLPLAEAFVAGVPSLATGWSGNMEFMSGLPELLIHARMIGVRDADNIYNARDQVWADPDLEHAAGKLKLLAASPELRKRLAEQGRNAVKKLNEAWSRPELEVMPWWPLVRSPGW